MNSALKRVHYALAAALPSAWLAADALQYSARSAIARERNVVGCRDLCAAICVSAFVCQM